MEKDQVLQGNEKIEEAIRGLQNEPTQEMLAHALTVVRRRMKENGHLIVAVDPAGAMDSLQVQTIQTADGKRWFAAFTGFEEQMKGSVISSHMTISGNVEGTDSLKIDGNVIGNVKISSSAIVAKAPTLDLGLD